jgi:hypothetical protein
MLGEPSLLYFHFEANNDVILQVAQTTMMSLDHDGAFLFDSFFICEFKV